jgi:hypothetical protein
VLLPKVAGGTAESAPSSRPGRCAGFDKRPVAAPARTPQVREHNHRLLPPVRRRGRMHPQRRDLFLRRQLGRESSQHLLRV